VATRRVPRRRTWGLVSPAHRCTVGKDPVGPAARRTEPRSPGSLRMLRTHGDVSPRALQVGLRANTPRWRRMQAVPLVTGRPPEARRPHQPPIHVPSSAFVAPPLPLVEGYVQRCSLSATSSCVAHSSARPVLLEISAGEHEILVLRHQLRVLRRNEGRPRLRRLDRVFLAPATRVASPFLLVLIHRPDSLLRRHRELTRRAYGQKKRGGRPPQGPAIAGNEHARLKSPSSSRRLPRLTTPRRGVAWIVSPFLGIDRLNPRA